MRTERVILNIGQANGRSAEVPMRFNLSHQHAYRCYFGPLADPTADIMEATEPSFVGSNLFDALAGWRATIEAEGWRLLHALARADCWPGPDRATAFIEQLTLGQEETRKLKCLDPAQLNSVTTLAGQRANFEAWMASLPPVAIGRVRPRAGHAADVPQVDFGPVAKLAGEILRSGEQSGTPRESD